MKRLHVTHFSPLGLLFTGFLACTSPEGGETKNDLRPATTRVELDRAARALELGQGEKPAVVKAKLDALLASDLSTEERDDALVLSSRAAELSGDKQAAVRALEQVLEHHDGQITSRLENVPKRLESLLIGHELRTSRYDEEERVAPVAYALAKYFPFQRGKTTEVELVRIDPTNGGSDESGTYNIGGAIRKMAEKSCPTCDPNVHVSSWGSNRWSSIPARQKQMARALTVIAMDVGDFEIPERYASWLALPLPEVEARLAQGQGLIVVKERPGVPPLILLAAPRVGQLPAVAEVFQKLETLPKEPLAVPLPKSMLPGEVRTTIRDARRTFASCYESLLTRNASAGGKITLQLTVDGQGGVSRASLSDDSTLTDAAFGTCTLDAARALHFPKIGAETTVRYPLTFTP
ncbi:MAG: AgmX/PglI C-terminal domain-containing protein [Polyangiaceae bacterium]